MSDMFNQSASTGGEQQSHPHDRESPMGTSAQHPAQSLTASIAGKPAMAEHAQPSDMPPATSPSSDASPDRSGASPSAADPVQQDAPPPLRAPPYTMFGIEIRPDAPEADLDRLASKLGRPRTNAAAEDLTRKWSAYIDGLRRRHVPFDKILQVMIAGEDQDAFKTEFTENQHVTDKTLRKFRTLVAAARADEHAQMRAGERSA